MSGSGIFVFDESMSAFRPRTTKNGNLPHLSWIMRKPEPLGTEFKSVSEAVTGVMMALEITRSKDDDTSEKYDDIVPKLGVSTKVSLRLAQECIKHIIVNSTRRFSWAIVGLIMRLLL